jgi:nucleoside-diphosphate-sugar epimerase
LQIKRKQILVTGGAGFIGSHIVESLVNRGAYVIVYDNFSSGSLRNLKSLVERDRVKVVYGDILNYEKLSDAIRGVDVVSHHAAQLEIFRSLDDPRFDLEVNIKGTLNVLQAALENDVDRVIYASSACVYGEAKSVPQSEDHPTQPQWPYGVSKLAAEKYCSMYYNFYGLKTVSLRYGIVYGSREWFGRVLTIFIKRVLEGKPPIIFGDGLQRRDFIHVSDVVQLHNLCIESDKAVGEVYNAGTGVGTTIKELARIVIECSGLEIEPIYEDVPEGSFSKYLPRRRIPRELKTMILDIGKAKRELGWVPRTPLKAGIKEEMDWARNNPDAWEVKGEVKV